MDEYTALLTFALFVTPGGPQVVISDEAQTVPLNHCQTLSRSQIRQLEVVSSYHSQHQKQKLFTWSSAASVSFPERMERSLLTVAPAVHYRQKLP